MEQRYHEQDRYNKVIQMDLFTIVDKALKIFFIIWIYVILYNTIGLDWIG